MAHPVVESASVEVGIEVIDAVLPEKVWLPQSSLVVAQDVIGLEAA